MTDIEKQIWIQTYSWHMASYQKRNECDGLSVIGLERCSQDAIENATDAVKAFRATQNQWITTETSQMLKALLDEVNTIKSEVDQKLQILEQFVAEFPSRWENLMGVRKSS
jgi:hypothetical protein